MKTENNAEKNSDHLAAKLLLAAVAILMVLPAAYAHEAFINLIGNLKVELTPNFLSPISGGNFSATAEFTDLNTAQGLYPSYNVTIENETENPISQINGLTTSATTISSFSYVFPQEGTYFIIIQTPQGETDFPIYVRSNGNGGLDSNVVFAIVALSLAVGFAAGWYVRSGKKR